jgi:hypothetical protein
MTYFHGPFLLFENQMPYLFPIGLLLPVMPTVMVGVRMMRVITMAVWPPKVKRKARDDRPSPPPIVIRRRWWWGRVITYDWSWRTTDFLDRFLNQLSILPNPLPHSLAIRVYRPFRDGFNRMSTFVIINHRLAIVGCISGYLIILICRVSYQGTNDGSCSQSD